jgi:hypothetical protein
MQTGVLVSAFWATAKDRSRRGRIERITTDTVKTRLTSLQLKAPIIAAIIVEPEAEKSGGHAEAVDDYRYSVLEHPLEA